MHKNYINTGALIFISMTYEADDLGRIGKIIPEPHHMEYYNRNGLNEIKELIDKNRYND